LLRREERIIGAAHRHKRSDTTRDDKRCSNDLPPEVQKVAK